MHRFSQVDVFTDRLTSGNPLAVVHDADDLSDAQLAAFARWTNLSETTFLLRPTDPAADYRVRIFTVNGQIPATVLIDGFVAGTWRITDAGLLVDTFEKLRPADREALAADGAGLLGFAEAGTTKMEFSHGE